MFAGSLENAQTLLYWAISAFLIKDKGHQNCQRDENKVKGFMSIGDNARISMLCEQGERGS